MSESYAPPKGDNTTENEALRSLSRPREDADLLKNLNEWYKTCRTKRIPFERQWWLNISFYFGRQWVQWSSTTASDYAKLIEPPAPPWRVRMVVNKILPVVRKELAKLIKERPQTFVVPASSDDVDLAAARAGEQISEHLWRDLEMNRVMRRALFWTLICGTGFVKDWYDKDKYDTTGIQGTIEAEQVTPFHILAPELDEEEIENQLYIIHAYAKPKEWVEQTYGKKVEADSSGSSVLEQKLMSALGLQEHTKKDYVAVKEAWIKPSKKFPDGGMAAWTKEKLLIRYDGWPYDHNEYPFSKMEHLHTGRFYGDSVVTHLIPLQKELNRTRSQLVEAKNRMAKPQLLAPRGSIDPNRVTSEPGLVITYQPGLPPPQPLPLTPIPQYVTDELERIQRDFDDISAQHEISRGSVPPGVEAATAISFLQEADDTSLSPSIASLEECIERIGRHFLSHVHQFWTAERTIRVTGESGSWESYVFTQQDIRADTDFRVQAGSAMPRSRAAKQAFIMELGKMQWIPPDKALRYLEMTETAKLYEELQLDTRHALRETMRLALGEQLAPNPWDNDLIHIMEHNNFCKKQEFEKLEDGIKQLIIMHIQIHEQQLQTKFMTGRAPDNTPMPPQQGGMPPQQGGQGAQPQGQPSRGPQMPQNGQQPQPQGMR